MRRFVSILVIVLLGFPALAGPWLGDQDARLPACCRRHGLHHCAMAQAAGRALLGSAPLFQAPSNCPQYPASLRANFVRTFALAPAHIDFASDAAELRLAALRRNQPLSPRVLLPVDRGPPSPLQA